jgi:hypothetical protein
MLASGEPANPDREYMPRQYGKFSVNYTFTHKKTAPQRNDAAP